MQGVPLGDRSRRGQVMLLDYLRISQKGPRKYRSSESPVSFHEPLAHPAA